MAEENQCKLLWEADFFQHLHWGKLCRRLYETFWEVLEAWKTSKIRARYLQRPEAQRGRNASRPILPTLCWGPILYLWKDKSRVLLSLVLCDLLFSEPEVKVNTLIAPNTIWMSFRAILQRTCFRLSLTVWHLGKNQFRFQLTKQNDHWVKCGELNFRKID